MPENTPLTDAQAVLTTSAWLSPVHALLTLRAPAIAAVVEPGQFVHVRVSPGSTSPLLRRPFSVAGVNLAHGTFRMLVRTIGRGTEVLASYLPGAVLETLGPLGRPFPEIEAGRDVVLVGGGVGVAPLLFFAEKRRGGVSDALYGAETESGLALADELGKHARLLQLATDDGTTGHAGFVTDLLPAVLDGATEPVVLACGPRPMMSTAAAICRERGVDCWASFEAWLGCGVGACLGCVIPAAGGGYVRICKDGPVFRTDEIDWGGLS